MTLYLIKITINLIVFYIFYKWILEGNKTHVFKRFYLILTPIIALVLPIIKIKSNNNIVLFSNKLEEIVIANNNVIPDTYHINSFSWQTIIIVVYIIGVIIALFFFGRGLLNFHSMIKQGKIEKKANIKFVYTDTTMSPFTFWNYIFLPQGTEIDFQDKIIRHELIHLKQKHTFDILYIEFLKCIFWFHPLFYSLKTAIALNHEFLADENITKQKSEAEEYLKLLLQHTYKQNEFPLGSSFNYNLTKKRYIMITKENNPIQNTIGKIATLLVLLVISTFSVIAQEKENTDNEIYTHVEKQAVFPGGSEELQKYIIDEISKQNVFKDVKEDDAKVILGFVVEKDGQLKEISIIRGINDEINNKMISILEKSPKWNPAENEGKIVRSKFVVPIQIQLDKTKK